MVVMWQRAGMGGGMGLDRHGTTSCDVRKGMGVLVVWVCGP